jgi:hypothetical protein
MLQDVRAKHPEYGDMSDQQLADGLHAKFYSDMPKAKYYEKIGLVSPAAQWGGVATRALAPYGVAITAGAAAGTPLAGVGAIPGAIAGAGALGLTDLTTTGYNLASPLWGGERIPTGSEMIQNSLERVGVGRRPQTQAQRIFGTSLEAAAGAGGQAKFLGTMAPMFENPVVQNTLRELSKYPLMQATSAAGATGTNQLAQDMGVTNPYALTSASVLGGLGFGGLGATAENAVRNIGTAGTRVAANLENIRQGKGFLPGTPSREALKESAQKDFKTAEDAGISYDPSKFTSFVDNLENDLKDIGFRPNTSALAPIKEALQEFRDAVSQPLTFPNLQSLRENLNIARSSPLPAVRKQAGEIATALTNFVSNATNATLADQVAARDVGPVFKSAIEKWAKLSKSDEIDRIIDSAKRSTVDTADALRSKFESLANNQKRLRVFSPDEQALIKRMAAKTSGAELSKYISSLGFGGKGQLLNALPLIFGSAMHGPTGAMIGAATGLTSLAGGQVVNALRGSAAEQQALNLAKTMRAGNARAPVTTTQGRTQIRTAIGVATAKSKDKRNSSNNALLK